MESVRTASRNRGLGRATNSEGVHVGEIVICQIERGMVKEALMKLVTSKCSHDVDPLPPRDVASTSGAM